MGICTRQSTPGTTSRRPTERRCSWRPGRFPRTRCWTNSPGARPGCPTRWRDGRRKLAIIRPDRDRVRGERPVPPPVRRRHRPFAAQFRYALRPARKRRAPATYLISSAASLVRRRGSRHRRWPPAGRGSGRRRHPRRRRCRPPSRRQRALAVGVGLLDAGAALARVVDPAGRAGGLFLGRAHGALAVGGGLLHAGAVGADVVHRAPRCRRPSSCTSGSGRRRWPSARRGSGYTRRPPSSSGRRPRPIGARTPCRSCRRPCGNRPGQGRERPPTLQRIGSLRTSESSG